MINFSNIAYLKDGNERQQLAFKFLTERKVLSNISAFDPILVGTIPIEIDIESSDLDIICCFEDKKKFTVSLVEVFGKEPQFTVKEVMINGVASIIANFHLEIFEVEIFGQQIPVKQQHAYRHLLIEHEILRAKGEAFRLEIIKLKRGGYKTEPAFARLLGLKGDPYLALLAYQH